MENVIKISVIIPLYNCEKYIERCILSILNQTFQDFEIIIINDCSTDNSIKVVEKYSLNDSRFVIINYEKNKGPMEARYTGYTMAKGEYFLFCDSDDFYPTNAFELLYNAIKKYSCDIVIGQAEFYPNNLGNTRAITRNKLSFGNDSNALYKSLFEDEISQNLWGKIYNRSLFDNYEYSHYEHFTNAEDAILFYEMTSNVSKVEILEETVYYYFYDINSLSHKKLTESGLVSIVEFYNILDNLFINKSLFSDYVKRSILRGITNLLLQGYSKQLIFSRLRIRNMNSTFSLKYFMKYFNIKRALIYFFIFRFPLKK